MISAISRRSVVAAVATMPIATTAQALPSHDSELIELGRSLDAALVPFSTRVKRVRSEQEHFEKSVFERTGMTYEEARELLDQSGASSWKLGPEKVRAYFETRHSLPMPTSVDDIADEREYDAIYDRLTPLFEAIRLIPATTIAGLAVKARAAMADDNLLWINGKEETHSDDVLTFMNLVEDILRVAGHPIIDGLEARS